MRKTLLQLIFAVSIQVIVGIIFVNVSSGADAGAILDNFRKEFKKARSYTADFEQTTLVAGRKRVAIGKLVFQKPNLFRQEFFDPSKPQNMTQLIVSDGKTILSYTPLINQVTRQDLSKKESSELFPGFGQSLEDVEKNYDLKIVKDELAEKQGVVSLELTPKSQMDKVMFDIMQVWVRESDSLPVQFMYKDTKNETTFVMAFKNVKLDSKVDGSIFKFKVPSGTQVITIPGK